MHLSRQPRKKGDGLPELPERRIPTQNLFSPWINKMFSKFGVPVEVTQYFAFSCNRPVSF